MTTQAPIRTEHCRDCKDELPHGTWPLPLADFILWGKFFEPAAFGPKCTFHARLYFPVDRIDQYAVYDLRPLNNMLMDLEDPSAV